MDNKIYLTRPNKENAATEDEVKGIEKSALSEFSRKKDVYIVEKFPIRFFQYATKIKIEKVSEPDATLSELANTQLFKITTTNNIFE